jgi:hypothetical protein
LDEFIFLDRIAHDDVLGGEKKDVDEKGVEEKKDEETTTKTNSGVVVGTVKQPPCMGKKCEVRVKDDEEDRASEWLRTSKKYVNRRQEWSR